MTTPIAELIRIMKMLRDPEKGCPWDVEQNFKSITNHTIEEAYEVVDAIEKGDMDSLREELGDLLLQVVFYAQMADEEGLFSFDDVAKAINKKLIDRHPHVFGDADIKTAKDQEIAWEKQKEKERREKARAGEVVNILDGIAMSLPALTRSVKIQKRAAKVGFDWPDFSGVFAKIREEADELEEAIGSQDEKHIKEEMGDLLFAVSNLSRKLKLDPEECLRACNQKFERRFSYIEQKLAEVKKTPEESNLEEMDKLWDEAKLALK